MYIMYIKYPDINTFFKHVSETKKFRIRVCVMHL